MYIAVDVGGTNIRVAACSDLDKPVFASEPLRRLNSKNYDSDIAFIVESAHKLGGDDIEAVGIGIVGTLNASKTIVTSSNNNAHWVGKTFKEDLARRLNCPVYPDNDAVVAAMAEAYYGETESNFAYLTWGTGIGGVLVSRGPEGGITIDNINDSQRFDPWEFDCGGRAIEKMYGKPAEHLSQNEWRTIFSKFADHTKKFVKSTSPEAIVFGGGLSVRHAKELTMLSGTVGIPCTVIKFDNDSGLYGGFALIRNSLR